MLNSIGLLILRMGAGGLLLFGHGWGKLTGFTGMLTTFPDPLGLGPGFSLALAVFAEVFCAAALMLGLATRFVAIPLLTTMLVAAFVVHADAPWSEKELAVAYAVPFATLILTGGGDLSLDALWRPQRRRHL